MKKNKLKRLTSVVAALILVAVAVFSLCGCGEKEKFKVTFEAVEGVQFALAEGYTSEVEAGGEIKFLVITELEVVIRANGTVVEEADGVYTVSNIEQDVAITCD